MWWWLLWGGVGGGYSSKLCQPIEKKRVFSVTSHEGFNETFDFWHANKSKENIVYNFWLGMIRDAWNDLQIKDIKVVL